MRTLERQEFLSDVIIGFVEGGPYSWFRVLDYHWFAPDLDGGTGAPCPGPDGEQWPNAYASLRPSDPEGDGWLKPRTLDPLLVEKGCERLLLGPIDGLHDETRARLIDAWAVNDAGLLDINDYDVIIQAAVYGEIVFS